MLIKRYLNEIGDKFKGALRTDIEMERKVFSLSRETDVIFARRNIWGLYCTTSEYHTTFKVSVAHSFLRLNTEEKK